MEYRANDYTLISVQMRDLMSDAKGFFGAGLAQRDRLLYRF